MKEDNKYIEFYYDVLGFLIMNCSNIIYELIIVSPSIHDVKPKEIKMLFYLIEEFFIIDNSEM